MIIKLKSRLSILNVLGVWLMFLLVACGSDDGGQKIAPEVSDFSPEENQENVSLTTDVQAAFNLAVEPSSVTDETFLLMDDGTPVPSVVEYDELLFTATLTPNNDLSPGTAYTAMITDGIKGLDGTKVVPLEWSFTTATGATYRATFEAVWSSSTHPNGFPPGGHFSGLIGMTHNENKLLFEEGAAADLGIRDMAELGSKTDLTTDIEAAISQGSAQFVISGDGVDPSPGSISVEFTITSSHPLVSITSMVVPSPDWFIAVESVNLFPNGEAVDLVTEIVQVYDAGTDSGTDFNSANQPSVPPDLISVITDPPLAENGMVAPMGSITFEKID